MSRGQTKIIRKYDIEGSGEEKISSRLGLEIRHYSKSSEDGFRNAGLYGLLSFILSFVEEGEGREFLIANQAVAICGEVIRQQIHDAVVEGMDRYCICEEGRLRLPKVASDGATNLGSSQPSLEHGFGVIRAAQNLRLAFNEAGQGGRISFAKACIWSGLTQPHEIVAEACLIGGNRVESAFEALLMEGENVHWRKCADGSLELMAGA